MSEMKQPTKGSSVAPLNSSQSPASENLSRRRPTKLNTRMQDMRNRLKSSTSSVEHWGPQSSLSSHCNDDTPLEGNLSQSDRDTIDRIRRSSLLMFKKFSEREDGFDQKYTLGKRLGEGMHSVVYECFSKSDGSPMAVKVSREEDEEKKLAHKNEYLLLKDLVHPSIVRVSDFY